MRLSLIYVTATHFFLLTVFGAAVDYDDLYGPEYGKEWLYFLDDNGTINVMNFSALPEDKRGLLCGNVYFYLYTRRNKRKPELLSQCNNNSLRDSKFLNVSNGIILLTHGWRSTITVEWLQNMKDVFLINFDLNVFTVDWYEIAKNVLFPWPALSTRFVGKCIAKFLKNLNDTYQLPSNNIHLIGHSLGAQVMGHAGMYYEGRIFRITGLDPARPLFEVPYMPKDFRLDKTDAEFVDIIHTGGGVFGYSKSHGHADFYPNGGKPLQPGCDGDKISLEYCFTRCTALDVEFSWDFTISSTAPNGALLSEKMSYYKNTLIAIDACSHSRAYVLFTESIYPDIKYVSYLCDSWEQYENNSCKYNVSLMGYQSNPNCRGNYYLRTNNQSIYAMDED